MWKIIDKVFLPRQKECIPDGVFSHITKINNIQTSVDSYKTKINVNETRIFLITLKKEVICKRNEKYDTTLDLQSKNEENLSRVRGGE